MSLHMQSSPCTTESPWSRGSTRPFLQLQPYLSTVMANIHFMNRVCFHFFCSWMYYIKVQMYSCLLLYINIVPRLFLTIGCTRGDMWLPDKHHPCWPLETYNTRRNKCYVQYLHEPNSDVAMQCKTTLIQTTFFSSRSLQCYSASTDLHNLS
jgi:hypothetical protein